jgi:uncharacterized protein (TIGR02217 family)
MTISIIVDDAQLPAPVQRGAQTNVDDPIERLQGWSGLVQRNRKNTRRPRMFQIGYGIKQQSDRQAIIDLFMTNGNLVGFLFKDWADYTITNQNIGTGNGTNRSFFLKKTYTNTATTPRSYDRVISRPVAGSISITVAGTPSSFWTLNPLGEILFNVGHAPAAAAAVVVTAASFLVPVAFVGKLQLKVDTDQKISVPTAQLEELFER